MNNSDRVKAMHLSSEELIEEAVKNNEGVIASNGAFSTINWGKNREKSK
jgi:ATP-dependent phosphoenolpyruvate carboxykinase